MQILNLRSVWESIFREDYFVSCALRVFKNKNQLPFFTEKCCNL